MLVRLTGVQASEHWEFLKVGINEALPPTVGMQSDRMSNILTAILTDKVAVWVSVNPDKENMIDGFVLTTTNVDEISGTKALLIYAVYGLGTLTDASWQSGAATITKFAKSEGCNRILGYSDVPSILKFVDRMGGETRFTLISLPI